MQESDRYLGDLGRKLISAHGNIQDYCINNVVKDAEILEKDKIIPENNNRSSIELRLSWSRGGETALRIEAVTPQS